MTLKSAQVWSIVHAERLRLVDDLTDAPDDAWTTASLCRGWSVHDVLAHLVDTAKTSRLRFAYRMLTARFDFDAHNEHGVIRERRADPRGTLDAMRAVVPLTRTPPAPLATRLGEAFVHGEDIRRPLGIEAAYPADAVARSASGGSTARARIGWPARTRDR